MAQQIRQTLTSVRKCAPQDFTGDMLAIGLFKNTKRLPRQFRLLDKAVEGGISNLLKLNDFPGETNETLMLYLSGNVNFRRMLLVGLGDKNKFDHNILRQVSGTAVRQAQKLKVARLGMALHSLSRDVNNRQRLGQVITEGIIVGRYDFQEYVGERENHKNPPNGRMRVHLLEEINPVLFQKGQKIGQIVAQAQNITRLIADKPPNEINPPALARLCRKWARKYAVSCKIFTDKQLKQMGMNAISAVGAGSASPPRLIQLQYHGRKNRKESGTQVDVVLVGKAVTFDSGGLDIKPASYMESMKFDKCGGCAVLGILCAAAKLQLPLNIVGLIPAVENMPSRSSYRPDDIIRTYSGKTVEIINTDAEGRMILSDALTFAHKMNPSTIIDMATLTGGCKVALGEHYSGLFGNSKSLIEQLLQAGKAAGEPLWHMPSGPEYLEQMRSKVADLKNTGGRYGSPCTAAAFLEEFVAKTDWAHIDIAHTAYTNKEKSYRAGGATGNPVRLIVEYLRALGK